MTPRTARAVLVLCVIVLSVYALLALRWFAK